jgi:galactose mutarotase-like enzyme
MTDPIHLQADDVTIEISPVSAELRALRIGGVDLLWPGGPEWPRSSPTLFPVIGRVEQDRVLWQGRAFPMTLHGFAHDAVFSVDHADARSCRMHLADSAATRVAYPFAFRLELGFAIVEARLEVTAEVLNIGDGPLPASFGFHPGFRWARPSVNAADRLAFINPRRGFPTATRLRTRQPADLVSDDTGFALSDASFAEGALFFADHASDGVRFTRCGAARAMEVLFSGLPRLALWTPPGARFFCIEPWAGAPDVEGYVGALQDKPYSFVVQPGEKTTHRMSIALVLSH